MKIDVLEEEKHHLTCSDRNFLGDHSPSYHSQSCAQTVSKCTTHSNSKWILEIFIKVHFMLMLKNIKHCYSIFSFRERINV